MSGAIETIREGGFVARLIQDEDVDSPKDMCSLLGTLVTWHRSYCFDVDGAKQFGTPAEFREQAKREGWVVLPVAMIDHSSISLYEGTSAHVMDPGGWDSGQVGFIYTTKERYAEFEGPHGKRYWRKRCEEILREELKQWDQFVTGDVWGYVVETTGGDHVDSCWGYYGYDYALSEMKGALKSAVAEEAKAEAMVASGFAL